MPNRPFWMFGGNSWLHGDEEGNNLHRKRERLSNATLLYQTKEPLFLLHQEKFFIEFQTTNALRGRSRGETDPQTKTFLMAAKTENMHYVLLN